MASGRATASRRAAAEPGENPRSGSAEVQATSSRRGRYAGVRDNMKVKEVKIPDVGDRSVICYNPDQASRDQAIRDDPIAG
jgi:hypothetical protein